MSGLILIGDIFIVLGGTVLAVITAVIVLVIAIAVLSNYTE